MSLTPQQRASFRVVHISSVHSPADPRIAAKECLTLARAGYDVTLVAPDDGTRPPEGVRYVPVPRQQGRLRRMTQTAIRVVRAAAALDPAVVHLHDPELIPWGLALRARRRRVIYDVHEDYSSALRVRAWMPDWARSTAALLWDRLEQLLGRGMVLVLAERYYAERFPRGTLVLNYPQVDEAMTHAPLAYQKESRRLLYTGNHTANRGAEIHARLLSRNPDVCLTSVGYCSEELAGSMRALAGSNADHLEIDGVGSYVTFDRIRARYVGGGWLAGLALFPRSDHYDRKELTKFYEYMLAGLPILASDSSVWREIVEGNRVGLCVDPADDAAVDQALAWLRGHPEDAADMAARGRQLAVERYGWASQGKSLVELYDSLVQA